MDKLFNYFAGNSETMTSSLVIIAMCVLLVFIALLIYIPVLTRKILPNFGYSRYSDYLPFDKVYDDNSLSLIGGGLVRVYKINGIQTSMMSDENREKLLDLRTQLFNQIQDNDVFLRFFTIRDFSNEKTNYEFDQPVLQKIYDKWNNQGLKIFTNNYYLVISVRGQNNRERLNQYCNYIESILSAYKPVMLKNTDMDNMSTFFGRILSPVTKPKIKKCDNNISNVVIVDEVEFTKTSVVEYTSGDKKYYAAMISFKTAPDYLDEDFYDTVSTIQCEMICMIQLWNN